jgi:hypothetical protein
MIRKLVSAAFFAYLFAVSMYSANAQNVSEVIIKQGDSIEWFALSAGPHGVKFGSEGGIPSFEEVSRLLEFPSGFNGESESKQTGRLMTARVKENAEVGKTFVFVCAIHSGATGPMVSHPFRIAAKVAGEQPRTHKILGVTGLHWAIHIDTTPPPPPQ